METIDAEEALGILADKRVAVVGNSADILERRHGAVIDEHDLVLRMNYGIPGRSPRATPEAIGRRTDIVAAAQANEPDVLYRHSCPAYLWWMKLTLKGWTDLQDVHDSALLNERGVRLWRWPHALEKEVESWVGRSPSTGIRVLYTIARLSQARAISAFGMSWWGAAGGSESNWWRPAVRGPSPAHAPTLEYRAFLSLGFHEQEPGWSVAPRS